MIFSSRITSKLITQSKMSLLDKWKMSQHKSGDKLGWSRTLEDSTKFGIVATANALESIYKLSGNISRPEQVLDSLFRDQRQDGSWAFKATLTSQGVVDSTANVVLAAASQELATPLTTTQAQSIGSAIEWLITAQRADGSWGVVASPEECPSRSYSTAIAVRALSVWPTEQTRDAVMRGGLFLLRSQHSTGGYWNDLSSNASVVSTAEALRALIAAREMGVAEYQSEISRARRWLSDVGATSNMWIDAVQSGDFEEVAVKVSAPNSVLRLEYLYSARAAAVAALLEAGDTSRLTIRALRQIIEDVLSEDWRSYARGRYHRPTSWMLHDVSTVVALANKRILNSHDEVWVGLRRTVRHRPGRSWASKRLHEYYPTLLAGLLIFAGTLAALPLVGTSSAVFISLVGAVGTTLVADTLVAGVLHLSARARIKRSRRD